MATADRLFRSLHEVEPAEAARLFPAALERSHLRLWRPADPIRSGRRLLVGIDLTCVEDLALLDVLDDAVPYRTSSWRHRGPWFSVDVFTLADAKRIDDYVPGMGRAAEIGVAIRTPVVGLWSDGELRDKAWGERGIRLLSDRFAMRLSWKRNILCWDIQWDSVIE